MSRVHIVEMLESALSLGGKESLRLLAPQIERLLAQEREKVRAECERSIVGSSLNDKAVNYILNRLLQLDLTKPERDLVASSREEKER